MVLPPPDGDPRTFPPLPGVPPPDGTPTDGAVVDRELVGGELVDGTPTDRLPGTASAEPRRRTATVVALAFAGVAALMAAAIVAVVVSRSDGGRGAVGGDGLVVGIEEGGRGVSVFEVDGTFARRVPLRGVTELVVTTQPGVALGRTDGRWAWIDAAEGRGTELAGVPSSLAVAAMGGGWAVLAGGSDAPVVVDLVSGGVSFLDDRFPDLAAGLVRVLMSADGSRLVVVPARLRGAPLVVRTHELRGGELRGEEAEAAPSVAITGGWSPLDVNADGSAVLVRRQDQIGIAAAPEYVPRALYRGEIGAAWFTVDGEVGVVLSSGVVQRLPAAGGDVRTVATLDGAVRGAHPLPMRDYVWMQRGDRGALVHLASGVVLEDEDVADPAVVPAPVGPARCAVVRATAGTVTTYAVVRDGVVAARATGVFEAVGADGCSVAVVAPGGVVVVRADGTSLATGGQRAVPSPTGARALVTDSGRVAIVDADGSVAALEAMSSAVWLLGADPG
jgi:hypothetical protein